MARSSERVQVLLAGPAWGGDWWGSRWGDPRETSPGQELVDGELLEVYEDGSADIRIGEVTRRIPEGTGVWEYRRYGDLTHDAIRQIRDDLVPLLSDPNAQIAKMSNVIKNVIAGTNRRTTAETLVRVARKLSPYQNVTDDLRRDALLLIGLLLCIERAEL